MRLSREDLFVISLLNPQYVAIQKLPVLVSQRDAGEGLWVHLVRRCANLKREGVGVVESFDAKGKTSLLMCWRDSTRHQKVVLRRRPMDLGVGFGIPSSSEVSEKKRLGWDVTLALFEVFGIAPGEQDPFENKTAEWNGDGEDCANNGDDGFS